MTAWPRINSSSSCLLPTSRWRQRWRMTPRSTYSILTPTVLPSVRPLKRLASISPDAASGRSSRWFWAEAPTSGSTSRCSLAGRRKASTSGTPGVRNPPSGNLTSRRKTRITGSGSTLIACEQTGRVCYTVELDEKFCDVIVRRYIEQVGSADGVTVLRDGLTYRFDEVPDTDN